MKVILKLPGEAPKEVEIGNGLEDLQKAVGGYIEHVPFGDGIGILVNEEGRFKGPVIGDWPTSLPVNFTLYPYGQLVGPALFIGEGEEDFVGLEDWQMDIINEFFRNKGVPIDG